MQPTSRPAGKWREDAMDEAGTALANALRLDLAAVVTYLPRLVAALVIVLVGWALARFLGWLADLLLARLGLDRLGERTGLDHDLAGVGLPSRPAQLVGQLTTAIVLIAALVQAADALALAPLSEVLRQLLGFTPHLLLGGLILLVGLVASDALGRAAAAALARAGVLYYVVAGTLVRVLVVFLALVMALQQLTIEATFLFDVLLVALAGAALTGAIAFGWGLRTLAENITCGRYVEQNFAVGDAITIVWDSPESGPNLSGTIDRLRLTSTILRTTDGQRVVIPNGVLARAVIRAEPSTVASAGAAGPGVAPDC
jgi:small-conductance mechanosensitive channel